MRRRHKAGFALASAVLHACGHQPVAIRTTGTTSTSSPSTTEATTTTAAPVTTAVPTTLAPEVEVPPTSALLASGAAATTTVPAPPTTRRTTTTVATDYEPAPAGAHAYGEWEIPTSVVMCESSGSWTAYNRSGASGPYQLMPEWFDGELAMLQPRSAQHAKAAYLWNGGVNTRSGLGPQNWAACL